MGGWWEGICGENVSIGETGTDEEGRGVVGKVHIRRRDPLLGPGSVADTMPISRVSLMRVRRRNLRAGEGSAGL